MGMNVIMGMNVLLFWAVNDLFKLFLFQGEMIIQHTSSRIFKIKICVHNFKFI